MYDTEKSDACWKLAKEDCRSRRRTEHIAGEQWAAPGGAGTLRLPG